MRLTGSLKVNTLLLMFSAPYLSFFRCCRRVVITSLSLFSSAFLFSCISTSSDRGVETRWREGGVAEWKTGVTTKGDVLKDLGPPSQVVGLGGETVFYYLRENMEVQGLVLILYNNVRVSAEYDRAIFFFDQKGVLSDMALSETSEADHSKE